MRWPNRETVDLSFRNWARAVRAAHPEVVRIGYFGSYASGAWGVGSDLDVVVMVSQINEPFGRRLLDITDHDLPVPADIFVYTEEELSAMRRDRRRLAREIDEHAVWAE